VAFAYLDGFLLQGSVHERRYVRLVHIIVLRDLIYSTVQPRCFVSPVRCHPAMMGFINNCPHVTTNYASYTIETAGLSPCKYISLLASEWEVPLHLIYVDQFN
jgi:hypothetical protein